ncbi:MAG: PP2C family protein-serine/threonine phosphatase, partial [Kiritimatiellia bacterium]
IESNGAAVGLTDPALFDGIMTEVSVDLHPGDLVITYTDGITEAMNAAKDEWGIGPFTDTCVTASAEGAHSLVNHVRERIQRFVGDYAQYDDMTLVALRVTNEGGGEKTT